MVGGGAKESWAGALAELLVFFFIWAASVAYARARREEHLQERWRLRNGARDWSIMTVVETERRSEPSIERLEAGG